MEEDIVKRLRMPRSYEPGYEDACECGQQTEADSALRGEAADEIERLRGLVAHLAVPVGYRLVPARPTPEILDAMRTGSHRDWPSDELCRVRYAALLAVAPNDQHNAPLSGGRG